MSRVTCYNFFSDNFPELVGGGPIINGAQPRLVFENSAQLLGAPISRHSAQTLISRDKTGTPRDKIVQPGTKKGQTGEKPGQPGTKQRQKGVKLGQGHNWWMP